MPVIEHEIKLDFKDVLIKPKRSKLKSRSEVDLVRNYKFPHTDNTFSGVPIMSANMDTTGTFEIAKVFASYKMITCIHKHYSIGEWLAFYGSLDDKSIMEYVVISSGISEDDLKKAENIYNMIPECKIVCLDVANGYSEHFVQVVKNTRSLLPDATIIAGNVVTGEMTEQLILSGADIVKVGIGPGSVCTTRKQTGVGFPQLSAIIECADAAHGLGGLIISDGGCTVPGDFGKAFGAGADFVMAGGMFAGHEESGGDTILDESGTPAFKVFYGMSSKTAMDKHAGGVAEYRSSEGKTVKIPYKGLIEGTVLDLLGGLRSTCTYVGAHKLKELARRTTFIRVNNQLNNVFSSYDEK